MRARRPYTSLSIREFRVPCALRSDSVSQPERRPARSALGQATAIRAAKSTPRLPAAHASFLACFGLVRHLRVKASFAQGSSLQSLARYGEYLVGSDWVQSVKDATPPAVPVTQSSGDALDSPMPLRLIYIS